jgi:hypothetical protein
MEGGMDKAEMLWEIKFKIRVEEKTKGVFALHVDGEPIAAPVLYHTNGRVPDRIIFEREGMNT